MSKGDPVLSPEAKQQQDTIHAFVGCLIAIWANTETIFINLLHHLLNCSRENAQVVYFSFTSIRARLGLIDDLATINLKPADRDDVLALTKRFLNLSAVRNELTHCEYLLEPKTCFYTGTASANIDDLLNRPVYTERPFDHQRLNEIRVTAKQLGEVGIAVWAIRERLFGIKAPPRLPLASDDTPTK
jgi:hypothetical protein